MTGALVTTAEPPPSAELADLVGTHQHDIWWYLRYLGADANTADDLTQETFIAWLHHSPGLRDPGAIGAYLRTIARNAFRRAHRTGALRPLTTADPAALEAEWERLHPANRTAADPDGLLAVLADCLAELPERMQRIVRLKYEQEFDGPAIADAVGATEGHVRVILHRARKLLHTCVTRKLPAFVPGRTDADGEVTR